MNSESVPLLTVLQVRTVHQYNVLLLHESARIPVLTHCIPLGSCDAQQECGGPLRGPTRRDTDTRAFCVGKCLPWKSHRGGKCSGLHLVGECSQGKEALVLQKARHPVPWSRPRSFTKLGETPWHSGCESSVGKRVRQIAQLFFLNCIKLGNNSTFLNLFLVMPFMPVKMVNFYFSMKN